MIRIIKLTNELQSLSILTLGATIHEWNAFSDQRNIVISNANILDYADPAKGYFNTTIGRVANRIKDGKFILNDKTYLLERNFHGNNHGHGGTLGFFSKEFTVVSETKTKVVLKYLSPDGDSGYPGNFELFVTYELDNEYFKVTYDATTDQDTIANITNHAHFNLSHENTILNHMVKVTSDRVLEIDKDLIPSGKYIQVKNTPFDLNRSIKLEKVIKNPVIQHITKGLDHAYLFSKDRHIVVLSFEDKNLQIETSYPGVQIYSMNNPVKQPLLGDRKFEFHAGIAFEPQFEPNAINIPNFNSVILRKDEKYHQEILYRVFEIKKAGN